MSPPEGQSAELPPVRLSGRIADDPSRLLHDEVLEPQFTYEVAAFLPWYVLVEKVLLLEHRRMALLDADQTRALAVALRAVTAGTTTADRHENLSDLAFAVERQVTGRLQDPPARWHVDRSRNDLQACVQLLHGRARMAACAEALLRCAETARRRAGAHLRTPMPGYTHLQPAQVVTPAFFLSALAECLIDGASRLADAYDRADRCPLGAGAMAGGELPWDRHTMARHLGFARSYAHPLSAVASRGWVMEFAAALSVTATALSRFVTDLMAWGGGAYGFLDLPDELSGISSAMPQKKNFPVLERIRGRTAHLTSWYIDVATSQRATSFGNSVEVAKEGSSGLEGATGTFCSLLRLLDVVLDRATFVAPAMREACEGNHLGGMSLANLLTLRHDIPWRRAQVIAGAYITEATRAGVPPEGLDAGVLTRVAAEHGHTVPDAADLLAAVRDPERLLLRKTPDGSAHPTAVEAVLADQGAQLERLRHDWRLRTETARAPLSAVDVLLDNPEPDLESTCATTTSSTR
ncbi:argininosuccinate lyase [Streptomyces sp. 021-4]|uniref:argininosuccinate lyase n=1 Tax=Streptomyces sp. 021-4 TaxID=2789260 RepID=UPI0039F63922